MKNYNDRVMEHFLSPRNAGTMQSPDAVGKIGDPEKQEAITVCLRIENDMIIETRFLCVSSPETMASLSVITDLARKRSVKEALDYIDVKTVSSALGELPPDQQKGCAKAVKAFRKAVNNYLADKQPGIDRDSDSDCDGDSD